MNCKGIKNGNNLGIAIRNANILIKRRIENSPIRKALDNATGMHGYIIAYIKGRDGEEVFQKDVEKRFSIRRSTATSILQLMEKNGLITREAVEYDARLKRIILTEKAHEMVSLFDEERKQTEEILGKDLSESERKTLIELLEKVTKNLMESENKECECSKCKKQEF